MESEKRVAKNLLWSTLTNFWVLFIMFGIVFFLEGYGKRYLPPSPENLPAGTVIQEEPASEAPPAPEAQAVADNNNEGAPAEETEALEAPPPVAEKTAPIEQAAVTSLKDKFPRPEEVEVSIEELDNESARQSYLAENKRLSSRKEIRRETAIRELPVQAKRKIETNDFIPFER